MKGCNEAYCTPQIIFQSVVDLRVYFLMENEDVDLQTNPDYLEWTLPVLDKQSEMLKNL